MTDNTNLKVKSAVILHENGISAKEIAELLSISTVRVYQLLKIDERRKKHEAGKKEIKKIKYHKIQSLT